MNLDDFYNEDLAPIFDALAIAKRKKYMRRWCKMCGVKWKRDIDYSNPMVHVEFMLCDIRNQAMLAQPESRQMFYDMLTPEELDIYLNSVDDKGNRYADIETPETMVKLERDLKKATKFFKQKGANC